VGAPAIVEGNRITGTCPNHLVPSGSGTAPAGPLAFSAPIRDGVVTSVLIGGHAAAVMGASGTNTPAHPGIVDSPYAAASAQVGRITSGSSTVLIGGRAAATLASSATCCVAPGTPGPGVPTVLIG
jgi:uncharacterized Zn-binding protein involved in type VI secretion